MNRMPRGRNQITYTGHCPEYDMPPMQRGPCFNDNYGKMDGSCGMSVSEFKSPMMNAEPPQPPAKKKRRTSNAMTAAAQPPRSPVMQDLLPPPLTGFGDTIVASNPFDDTPPVTPSMPPHMNPMNHVNKHNIGVGACMSPGTPMMNSMSPCHMVGSPMACGPSIGSPISCGPPSLGNCNPMGGPSSNNPNCGSPHPVCNTGGRQVSRSPLVCTPMSTNSVMNNSPMNVNSVIPMNRSPSSLGSPLGSVMASNVRGNSPLDCGLGMNSVGSQKGSPMSVMSSHNIGNLNCNSPMGSPSNVSLSNCNSGSMLGSPITSPLNGVPCSLSGGGSDLGIGMNGVMNRSPMNGPINSIANNGGNMGGNTMMCNSSMRGPSPISATGLPMMNCGQNQAMLMGQKGDIGELGMRENCGPGGPPMGHMPVKTNGPGGCGMPMSNACTRQSEMGMQCGPMSMNNPHCNPMMGNQCGPPSGMVHGPCIGGGVRPQCGPAGMGPMDMGPFDGMNTQCRPPNMNRSQFPRGMPNVHYNGPPGGMNGGHMGMNGPMGGGPGPGPGINMGGMCGPGDMGGMNCGPPPPINVSNANSMHCDTPMNNAPPCMTTNVNPCSGPSNSIFHNQFGGNPFDVNGSRCSPNLQTHFNPEMTMNNNNFYRPNTSGPNVPPSCIPNMHPVSTTPSSTSAGVVLSVPASSISTNTMKNDPDTDNDIASMVGAITSDAASNLDLLSDDLLRDTKSLDDIKSKATEFDNDNGRMLKDDENGKLLKTEPDESKQDSDSERSECTTTSMAATTAMSTTPALTTTNSITTSTTPLSSTVETNEDTQNSNKSGTDTLDSEFDTFKPNSGNGENVTSSSSRSDENESKKEETTGEEKIKDEPSEEKLLDNEFNEDGEKSKDEKTDATIGSDGTVKTNTEEVIGCDKDSTKTVTTGGNNVMVKMENDDSFNNNAKNVKNECLIRGNNGNGGAGFGGSQVTTNTGIMTRPGGNFNTANVNEMSPNMMGNSICMGDSICGTPSMMPGMNRGGGMMPNAMGHGMNYPGRPINKVYPMNKTKIFNPQTPNAPPIYTCGGCHKEVNDSDNAVLCESGCYFWYHRGCAGLTEMAYQLLTIEVYAEWVCDKCLNSKNIPLVKYKP